MWAKVLLVILALFVVPVETTISTEQATRIHIIRDQTSISSTEMDDFMNVVLVGPTLIRQGPCLKLAGWVPDPRAAVSWQIKGFDDEVYLQPEPDSNVMFKGRVASEA
ncbi:unnamed protein product [Cercospora beticola]|nr:unnamed protein product [Cercospora beticola]